ncbi:MAG: ABC transporter ATP-binding protein [Spirochaetaceae bacterium]|nr:ABC transporter ATP-binding protein [Spirochaetaceae bacterium]
MAEIVLSGVSRSFWNPGKEIAAVRNLNLRIPSGGFIGIIGKSGCGKTTLLKLLAGLEQPDAGTIQCTGAAPRFSLMFQDPRLLPWLTVEQNVRLAFPAKGRFQKDLDAMLDLVGLGDWKGLFPRKLSGGMAQRVALARALCRKPQILLLDEPFGALDAFTRKQLREELSEIWKTLAMTVILVTHDIEEAVYLSDEVIQMKNGTIDAAIKVELSRPRDCRSPEFQRICRNIEDTLFG